MGYETPCAECGQLIADISGEVKPIRGFCKCSLWQDDGEDWFFLRVLSDQEAQTLCNKTDSNDDCIL